MRHSKLSNNPNALHEEGKPNSIELIEDISSKKAKKINNMNIIYLNVPVKEKIKKDEIDIKDENNINNINTSSNKENTQKIDEDSIHSYNSYKKKKNSINQKF